MSINTVKYIMLHPYGMEANTKQLLKMIGRVIVPTQKTIWNILKTVSREQLKFDPTCAKE